MKCINASSLFRQISFAINEVDALVRQGADSSTQSYLAKYLTVYITGIYEQSVEEIIWEYASSVGTPEIENFVSNQLDKFFRNPDMAKIIGVVKQFSTAWSEVLKNMDLRYKDAITSMVNNKNLIAHGQPSQITLADVKNYHRDASVIIEKIDNLFLGI